MPNVSDHLLDKLAAWNVRRLFGYSGDGINGVMAALDRAGDRFDFVPVAHEELAGLMATAHAKFTGEVGVCLCTSGPGAIHMLNGLYDAKLDHQPVVAIVGQQAFAGVGGSTQQETNLRALLQDVASSYLETVTKPEQLAHVVDRAFRAALGNRTVAAIILPHDVQLEDAVPDPPQEHGRQHSASGYTPSRRVPPDDAVRRAAEVLNAGERVAILVGAGARGASDIVERIAHALGAGVAKAFLGKDVLPDDLPFVTGSVGWLGTPASNRMMRECDTLLMIGTNFPYTEFLPTPEQARAVQIDVEPRNLALRYPVEVALEGDAAETLALLAPLLVTRAGWRATIEAWTRDSSAALERHAMAPADPINPQRALHELSQRLPDDAIVTADSGSSSPWVARHVRLRRGMRCSVSGNLATMGCAIPYALAAKLAHPSRSVIAVVGDGAMQMSGMSALIDVARHAGGQGGFAILVLNNRDLNYVTWEQRAMDGERRYVRSEALPDLRYAEYAKLLGLDGVRVEDPDALGAVWDRALASPVPFVIDAVVDPTVPTLPPELKPEQEDKLAKALENDPEAGRVLEQMQRQEIRQRG